MRLLFYGLQNSGATLLTMLAGQRPGSLVIPDLWSMYPAPAVDARGDVCIKATVTTTFPLARHIERFRPDHVFVVTRRPEDNLLSLRRKTYANHNGTVAEKFEVIDDVVDNLPAGATHLLFEDVMEEPALLVQALADVGWELPADATELRRGAADMERDLRAGSPALYAEVQWGVGEARADPLRGSTPLGFVVDDEATEFCRRHAPVLQARYERRGPGPHAHVVRRTASAADDAALQARRRMLDNQLAILERLLRSCPSEALDLARELCAWLPTSPDALNAQARALEAVGDPEGAVALLADAPVTGERRDAVHLQELRARQALRLGQLDRCVELATEATEMDPAHVDAWLLLADVAVRRQSWARAGEHAARALSLRPRSGQALLLMARASMGTEDRESAVRSLRACLAVAPDQGMARQLLAELGAD